MLDLSRAVWRKSSHSCTTGCVEVSFIEGSIAVRDSKEPSGPVLCFNREEWQAFLEGIRDREFDIPDSAL